MSKSKENNAKVIGVIATKGESRGFAVQVVCDNNVPLGENSGRSKMMLLTSGPNGGFKRNKLSARINLETEWAEAKFGKEFLATLNTDKFTSIDPIDAEEFFGIRVGVKVTESTKPSYAGQTEKVNPTTGEVLKSGGQPIYRDTEVLPIEDCEPEMHVLLTADKADLKAAAAGTDAVAEA